MFELVLKFSYFINFRMKEAPDDKITDDDIKSIALSIEHELHKYHGDTSNKYKTRFRSLIFNIKDPKNKVY